MRRLVGIDLGTTNSAVAWVDAAAPLQPRLFDIPQLVAAGEIAARPTLPSFLYFPSAEEQAAGLVTLPWDARSGLVAGVVADVVAGVFARDHGASIPARQVASAKSWLANRSVDRRSALLPLHAEGSARLSPVQASAVLLAHLKDAWNSAHPAAGMGLQEQAIVLTVPASFDEEARELTVEAARDAGLTELTLLEEPLAALYAWMATHASDIASTLHPGQLLLVCDVGGGTTDFSLIRGNDEDSAARFERVAIGEHLLLGGDNVDVALAALLERRLAEVSPAAGRIGAAQRQALRRQASAAKERLLGVASPEQVNVTLLGGGGRLVGGSMTTTLTRQDVLAVLNDFLPAVAKEERPQRQLRGALRELGLPYESDPAVTRHLAAFLERAARAAAGGLSEDRSDTALLRPDAILFNGGFFTPAVARERILEALESWFGSRPTVLTNDAPDAAVAIGAAFYGGLRLHAERESHRRLLIRSGSARTYYVGVQGGGKAATRQALCVMPRGTDEGTRLVLAREFTVIANQPAAFSLFSSLERQDALNDLVDLGATEQVHVHAPLVTALRFGQRSRKVPLAVRLSVVFTAVGTLELWCESVTTEHRWRLQFNLRAVENAAEQDSVAGAEPVARAAGGTTDGAADGAPAADGAGGADGAESAEVLIGGESVAAAEVLLREVFASRAGAASPDTLVGQLENVLGHGKHAWPLPIIRRLADVLLQVEPGRRISARHEARWLNLAGFCLRPGFGASTDPWRVTEARKVYAQGLAFPNDVQCQVEWQILWQRVSAGFNAAQQQELANRMIGLLGLGKRKGGRLNPQLLRDAWRLLAGLERLDRTQRARLGDELIGKVRREPQNSALAWAIGRFGARMPLYGPLSSVVTPEAAERWLEILLGLKSPGAETIAAIAQMAARTDDHARDIGEPMRARVVAFLQAANAPHAVVRGVRQHVPVDRASGSRLMGESLPEGLRLE